MIEKFNLAFDANILCEKYLKYLIENSYLIEDSSLYLETLGLNNKHVGIITNGIHDVQYARLKNTGLMKFIDFIVVLVDCGFAKPHRAIF